MINFTPIIIAITSLVMLPSLNVHENSAHAKTPSSLTKSTSGKESPKDLKTKGELAELDQQISAASTRLVAALNKEIKTAELPFATLAVLPFKALDKGATRADVDAALTELFSNQLSSRDKVIGVERARIQGVIGELKKAQSQDFSAKGAAQAGKLLGARYVLVGSITTMGSTLQVTTRLVISETGEVLKGEVLRAPRQEFISFQRDVVIPRSKTSAAIRSMLVPGWGQLYNGHKLTAYTTLLAGFSALGTAAAYGFLGSKAESKYQKNRANTVSQREIANDHYLKARIALWSYAAIWSYAIMDAYISGQNNPKIDLSGWSDLESAGVVLSGQF